MEGQQVHVKWGADVGRPSSEAAGGRGRAQVDKVLPVAHRAPRTAAGLPRLQQRQAKVLGQVVTAYRGHKAQRLPAVSGGGSPAQGEVDQRLGGPGAHPAGRRGETLVRRETERRAPATWLQTGLAKTACPARSPQPIET